jgi:predicted transcriptional regulator
MPDKIYHSKKLNLRYKIKQNNVGQNIVVFEDDVNYSQYEMNKLKNLSDCVIIKVHSLKKIFKGVIV